MKSSNRELPNENNPNIPAEIAVAAAEEISATGAQPATGHAHADAVEQNRGEGGARREGQGQRGSSPDAVLTEIFQP
jgi:hypothetical protein